MHQPLPYKVPSFNLKSETSFLCTRGNTNITANIVETQLTESWVKSSENLHTIYCLTVPYILFRSESEKSITTKRHRCSILQQPASPTNEIVISLKKHNLKKKISLEHYITWIFRSYLGGCLCWRENSVFSPPLMPVNEWQKPLLLLPEDLALKLLS